MVTKRTVKRKKIRNNSPSKFEVMSYYSKKIEIVEEGKKYEI